MPRFDFVKNTITILHQSLFLAAQKFYLNREVSAKKNKESDTIIYRVRQKRTPKTIMCAVFSAIAWNFKRSFQRII